MIVYQQAFDLFHTVYRMLRILSHFNKNDYIEINRLRIWDFYFLFPNKLSKIRLQRSERDLKNLIDNIVRKRTNTYEDIPNERIMFEKIKPFQMAALKYLASYGLINKDYLSNNKITKISNKIIESYIDKFEPLTTQEVNTLKLLTSQFYDMPFFGENGFKNRTKLMESKYDAK